MAEDIAKIGIRIGVEGAERAERELKGVERAGSRAEQQFDRLKRSAVKLAGGLVGLTAARQSLQLLGAVSKAGRDFEAALSDLSAITGATGKQLDYLSDRAKELGRTTTLTASQAAEATKLIASAKPDLLETSTALAAVTEQAVVLAEATGSTLPDAATTLGSALNQFQSGADSAGRFINVLAAGAKFGASEVRDTAEALKFAGSVASAAGISFESTNAAIQQLSTVAIKGSEAGTALRNTILRLESQTEDRFKPSVVGLVGALQNLADENLTTAELTELFGVRSVVAAQNLIQQASAVDTLTQKVTGTGVAYEQQQRRVDNFDGAIKALKSAMEGVAISISEDVNPSLRTMTETLTRALNAYTDFKKAIGEEDDNAFSVLDFALQESTIAIFEFQARLRDLPKELRFIKEQTIAYAKLEFDWADVIGQKRQAEIAALEKQIDIFKDKVRFGEASAGYAEQEADAAERRAAAAAGGGEGGGQADREAELERLKKEARAAQVADNARAIEDVRRRYRTETEEAAEAARAQLEILSNLTGLTAEQESQRIEIISRIRSEAAEAERDAILSREEFLADLAIKTTESEIEREQLRHEQKLQRIYEEAEELGVAKSELHAYIEKLEDEHHGRLYDIMLKNEKKLAADQTKVKKKTVDEGLGELARLTAGTAQHSKTMFRINKIAAIADATVNTAKGVTKTLSEYPWPLAGILAAAHAAAGVAQISAIQSTSFEGGGGGTTPSTVGNNSVINDRPVDSSITTDRTRADEQQSIQIIVAGNYGFNDDVIDQIAQGLRDATGDRDITLFDSDSRQAQELVEVVNNGGS